MRLVVDTIEFGMQHVQQWNTISISGYHIREAGSTAAQELAFTLADGMEYVRWAMRRGLDVDDFAPRLSFFFNAHNDFFEEIAKYRAARRIWGREMRETFGAKNQRAWLMRFHTQTAGVSLTAQQPENNIVRVALQALAAVLGGTQSLHTNSMDEALALPSEEAVTIALRTQQIIAEESGVANTVDPLGGSFFVEAQTDRIERQAYALLPTNRQIGRRCAGNREGFFPARDLRRCLSLPARDRPGSAHIVGVNAFAERKTTRSPSSNGPQRYERQVTRLNELRASRDQAAVGQALDRLRLACQGTENVMPHVMEAVHRYATLGEIVSVMKDVFGTYTEPEWI